MTAVAVVELVGIGRLVFRFVGQRLVETRERQRGEKESGGGRKREKENESKKSNRKIKITKNTYFF